MQSHRIEHQLTTRSCGPGRPSPLFWLLPGLALSGCVPVVPATFAVLSVIAGDDETVTPASSPDVVNLGLGGSDAVISGQTGDAVLTGTTDALGGLVTIASGDSVLGVVSASNDSGLFQYSLTEADLALLGQGAGKTIRVRVESVDGNATEQRLTVAVDTVAPEIASVSLSWGAALNSAESNQSGTVTVETTGVESGQELVFTLGETVLTEAVTDNRATLTLESSVLQGLTDQSSASVSVNLSDRAGNPAAPFSEVFAVDRIAPSQTLEIDGVSEDTDDQVADFSTNQETVTVSATLSSALLAGEVVQVSVDGGSSWSEATVTNDTEVTATGIDATGSPTVQFRLVDAADNVGASSPETALTFDGAAPTVLITDDQPGVLSIADDVVGYTVTFSEAVFGFDANDLTVVGGEVSNFEASGDGAIYTFDVTASGDGASITVDLGAGAATDAAGNANVAASQAIQAVDRVAPTVIGQTTASTTQVVLTLSETLDDTVSADASAFTLSANDDPISVTEVQVSGSTVTLSLAAAIPDGALVLVQYDAPSGAGGIVDRAGNPLADYSTGVVADGYIRGGQLYVDRNRDGVAQASERLEGVVTDANGQFFLPADANAGSDPVLVIGGVNIDTGVANTLPLKAPAGAVTINPITTLVQTLIETSDDPDPEAAQAQVVAALGLTEGTDLSRFDPLSQINSAGDDTARANALAAQKAAVSFVAVVALATEGVDAETKASRSATIISNVADQIRESSASGAAVDLSDNGVLSAVLADVEVAAEAVSAITEATSVIKAATDLVGVRDAQRDFLDRTAPNPVTDVSVEPVHTLNTVEVIVGLDVLDTGGGAVVVGDTLSLFDGETLLQSHVLTLAEVASGRVTVGLTELTEGSYALVAQVIDQAGNRSALSEPSVMVVDLSSPTVVLAADRDGLQSGEETAVTFRFSETVVGFDAADVSLSGATFTAFEVVSAADDEATVVTATVRADAGQGSAISLQVLGDGFQDAAGNPGVDSEVLALSVDNPPNVSITPVMDQPGTVSAPVALWVQFSETVTGFDASDLTVTGGLVTDFQTINGGTYQVEITPVMGQEGELVVSIDQGRAFDQGNNGNVAAIDLQLSVDTKAPDAPTMAAIAVDDRVSQLERSEGVHLTGTAEADSRIRIAFAEQTRSVMADAEGQWSYGFERSDWIAFGQGAREVSVLAVDAAGNPSATVRRTVTIDTVNPVLSIPVLAPESETGIPGDGLTNQARPVLLIQAEAGVTLAAAISTLGDLSWIALGEGTGSLERIELPESLTLSAGETALQFEAIDAVGNRSVRFLTVSTDLTAPTLDATPVVSVLTDDAGGTSLAYRFAWSEPVFGLTAAEVSTNLGEASKVQVSDTGEVTVVLGLAPIHRVESGQTLSVLDPLASNPPEVLAVLSDGADQIEIAANTQDAVVAAGGGADLFRLNADAGDLSVTLADFDVNEDVLHLGLTDADHPATLVDRNDIAVSVDANGLIEIAITHAGGVARLHVPGDLTNQAPFSPDELQLMVSETGFLQPLDTFTLAMDAGAGSDRAGNDSQAVSIEFPIDLSASVDADFDPLTGVSSMTEIL